MPSKFISIGIVVIIFIVVLYNVLLCLMNKKLYPSSLIKKPIAESGKDGKNATKDGIDGIDGQKALPGKNGIDGVVGFNGRSGLMGEFGDVGNSGDGGDIGVGGLTGSGGLHGPPSNSVVPVTLRYDFPVGDSYVMTSTFPYENENYNFSLHCNVFNNVRFNLKPREVISSEYGFLPTGSFGAFFTTVHRENDFIYDVPANPALSAISAVPFISRLRILIGFYKKGTSQSNFDDTIFYVSPPIERRSALLSYVENKTLPLKYKDIDLIYPVGSCNNFNDFFFIKTKLVTSDVANSTSIIYHVLKGIGQYELSVNVYPQLPDDTFFCYRIVEEFMNIDMNQEFSLPKITLSSTATPIVDKLEVNSQKYLRTISSRFDINSVVKRDCNFNDVPWIQTDQTSITSFQSQIPVPKIPFETLYNHLILDKADTHPNPSVLVPSFNDAITLPALVTPLEFDRIDVGDSTHSVATETLFFYISSTPVGVPLNKFVNKEKFYMELHHSTMDDLFRKYFCVYGGIYETTLCDFVYVYGKRIWFSRSAKVGNNYPNIVVYTGSPIKVGYIHPNGDRYTTIAAVQKNESDLYYFIDIPLFGYKKE